MFYSHLLEHCSFLIRNRKWVYLDGKGGGERGPGKKRGKGKKEGRMGDWEKKKTEKQKERYSKVIQEWWDTLLIMVLSRWWKISEFDSRHNYIVSSRLVWTI